MLNKAFDRFKTLADLKKEVFDEDLDAIVADEEVMRGEEKYKLSHITVTCGSFAVATATVQMEIDGNQVRTAELGDGPVDATLKAIKKLTKTKAKLMQYNVGAITSGTDAQGEVTVRVDRRRSDSHWSRVFYRYYRGFRQGFYSCPEPAWFQERKGAGPPVGSFGTMGAASCALHG